MYAEIIGAITSVERNFDTASLTYGGVNYWPLCRLRLWSALVQKHILSRGAADGTSVPNRGPQWSETGVPADVVPMGVPALGLYALRDDAGSLADRLTPDALFFVRPEEHGDTVGDGRFAKTLDSVLERTASRFQALKIELADLRTLAFRRTHPSAFLHLESASRGVLFDPPYQPENFGELQVALAAEGLAGLVDEAGLRTDLGKIFYFAAIFEKVLTLLAPRVFFISAYYHPVGMAWMLACRRRGITTIDVQHGRLGPHHGLYTDLTAAPADGYALAPDHIWCWGPQTKSDIARANNACRRHTGVVGGNAWLAKWRYGPPLLPDAAAAALDERCAGRRIILVSLQPLDAPVRSEMLQAMKQSPPEWLWFLRLHPLRRQTLPAVAELLAREGIANVELELATDLPLFALLRRADHHVTVFSSVVVEAAAFDLQSSLVGVEGLEVFAPQIARGYVRYTPTASDLLTHISEALQGPREPLADDFIDMRPDAADLALNEMIQS